MSRLIRLSSPVVAQGEFVPEVTSTVFLTDDSVWLVQHVWSGPEQPSQSGEQR
jgi:hypothetical protein